MSEISTENKPDTELNINTLKDAFSLMAQAKSMTELYEENKAVTSKYVHATSRGHEAIQLACAMQLKPQDWVAPYYRDDSILLGIGMRPYDCMLQLLAKRDDPFSGGRTYYSHPSLRDDDKPKIPHQSSATGMQAIPTTGVAMGIKLKEIHGMDQVYGADQPVVVCSIGDAAMTEGEVAEAMQMAALKQLPIIYLVQDNGWDISANEEETRAMNAAEYALGFKKIETRSIDGSVFSESFNTLKEVIDTVRKERRPFLIHAKVPLLNHHTSGVRMETYRHDEEELAEARSRDPYPKLIQELRDAGVTDDEIEALENEARTLVESDYHEALQAEEPRADELLDHYFAPTPVTAEKGIREPEGREKTVMVDAALFAIKELMHKHPEALLYGQDVGARIGGVFREAATLAKTFGDDRVFNTPIQEAFIVGSTVGMSAVGLKPIVEVQFADYIWPGLNQLFTEVSRSCYLSNGKWPVSMILRVPIGAYGSGGPFHSSSVESVVTNIRGVKVAYPSTGADLKGLMKSAYYDPNPVVMLEHKGLYWSKIKGTEAAKTIEPDEDYIIPFGKGRIALEADQEFIDKGESVLIVTYGMGVYWASNAAKNFTGQVEILDLRSLIPWDHDLVYARANAHGRIIVLAEEPDGPTIGRAIAGKIQEECFTQLDAPVVFMGSVDTPAIPLNSTLEATMLPDAEKVSAKIEEMLAY
jgi:2-oxoisovalerate dehydrogenase E1 component